ncbi:MFS transporter [Thermodesulfobacteriota bacterium]
MVNKEGHNHVCAARVPFFYGYVIAAAGFVIWMVGFGISNTFGIFYKPMMEDFGWTRADTVFAFSLGTFMMAVLSIASGWLTDKFGPRIVVTVFGSFLGIAYLMMANTNTLWQFHLSYGVIASIGMSVTSTPIMATVARWFVRRRGLMTGIVQAGLGIGGLILVPLTGWLILNYGWRTTYWVLGIIALIGIILPGLFMKRDPRDVGQFSDGTLAPPALTIIPGQQKLPDDKVTLRRVFITRQFWLIAGLYAIFGFCRSTFIAHTAAHVQDKGFSLLNASNVVAALMVSSIVGRIGMGRLADAIGSRPAFMISYAVTAVSLIWVLITGELWGLFLFAFAFGFGWGAQAVLRFSVTAEAFGLVSLGLIMGILGIGEAFAAALGSYYAGFIFDVLGHYRPAFWTGVVLSMLGIILAGFLKPLRSQ